MKTTVFAILTLILIAASVFFNSYAVCKTADSIAEELRSLPNDVTLDDSYRDVQKSFESHRRFLNLTVSHDVLLSIECGFAELLGAAEADDLESLIITKSRLVGEFSHLRRLSGVNFDSIF